MSRVYDAVKDCIGYRRVTYHVVPVGRRVLRCYDNGFPFMPVLDDFKQYGTLLGIKRHDEQVVKDEQPASLNLLESENSNFCGENGKERQNFSLPSLWVNDFFYNFPVY